jgi:hypothetical protein
VIEVNGFRTYQGIVMLFMRVGICFSEFMFVKNSNPDNMPPPRPPPLKKTFAIKSHSFKQANGVVLRQSTK